MHPRIEHLLSLRDGEPVAVEVPGHVAHCQPCAATLQDLSGLRERLQQLPAAPAVPGGWDAVRRRMAARVTAESRRVLASRIAVAASLGVIAMALAWRATDGGSTPGGAGERQAPLAVEDALALDRVAQLQSQSQALDAVLAAFGDSPAVERAGTAVPIDTIEAQVQWVDHQLSTDDGLEASAAERLWRERVDLMNSLVRLRYVEAQRIDM
ncbi:MAG TPA: hypothetical protein VF851_06790 [Steroidobacteraceae bacterium]